MKYIASLLLILGLVLPSFGQDTLKAIKANVPGQVSRPGGSMPYVSIEKAKELTSTPSISGNYTIDHYAVQLRKTSNKNIIEAVGSPVIVTEISVAGESIDSINFQISDRELMSTEDYLYRVFGELPEELPTDLPATLYVFKTNNLECYGIGQLSDGTLLIPREGILLYLKPAAH